MVCAVRLKDVLEDRNSKASDGIKKRLEGLRSENDRVPRHNLDFFFLGMGQQGCRFLLSNRRI